MNWLSTLPTETECSETAFNIKVTSSCFPCASHSTGDVSPGSDVISYNSGFSNFMAVLQLHIKGHTSLPGSSRGTWVTSFQVVFPVAKENEDDKFSSKFYASCLAIVSRRFCFLRWSISSVRTKMMWAASWQTNKLTVRTAKIQISVSIRQVWSESSLSAWRKLGSLATHWAHSEDWSDWADAQAELSLRWAHISVSWFCHEAIKMMCIF